MFSVGGVWLQLLSHLGMQLKPTSVPLRNAIKGVACVQTSIPMQLKELVYKSCVYLRKFIVSSGASGLIVAMLKWQEIVMRVKRNSYETGAKTKAKTESQNAATTL